MAAVLALACIAVLGGCMGGSDGIENPKVELDFKGPDGTSSGAGEVRIYARHLNPMVDSAPLLTRTFSGQAAFTLEPEEMDAILRARLGGVLPDTVVDFNVIAVSGDREAFVSGFRYKRAGTRVGFAQSSWDEKNPGFGKVKKTVTLLTAVLGFKGTMGSNGMVFGIDYVYIPGSPYFATVTRPDSASTRGEFRIARMSQGSYGVVGADKDSSTFYRSGDTLNTTDTAYTASTWDVLTIID